MSQNQSQNQNFTYYAFISYSHKDQKWAKWLQKKLESYRLPTVIRKESGKSLPRRIAPVFLDATDLTVGKLNDKLNQELAASRYLIVICSPNSARPNQEGKHYVNAEVTHFCELGREENIIPVIVDGKPDDSDRDCFCPKIHELGLIGLDATKQPRARILNDVVAKILSLRPDVLWQREKRRILRRRIMGSLAGVFLLAITMFSIWAAWDMKRVYTEYYADYVDQWGLPHGIFPLKKEQTQTRQYHYRFVYRDREKLFGKRVLREVIQCNSAGTPSDHIDLTELPEDFSGNAPHREIWQKPGYDSDFKLIHIDVCDSHEVLEEHRVINGKQQNAIDFKRKDKDDVLLGAFQSSSSLSESAGKSEIQRWKIDRDTQGRSRTVMFFRNEYAAAPCRNADGFFGMEYVYDDFGRVVTKYYLDEKGNRMALKNGLYSIQYAYLSNAPALISISKLDQQGKEMCKHELTYDENGNPTSYSFFSEGKVRFNDSGFAHWKCQYDEHGNITEEEYFGIDGKPCISGNGCATRKLRYDEQGNMIEEACFGVDGKTCLHKYGFAKATFLYDERGNKIEQAYFGLDDKPCINKNGLAKAVMQYDEQGNMIERAYFGVDGKPCSRKDGHSKVTWRYDERGNQTENAFYGVDGKLCLIDDGYAKAVMRYDERGNKIEQAYFGVDGKPCLHRDGNAKFTAQYDERGNVTEESFFGIDGKPCLYMNCYAKTTAQYDERGNATEQAFFGIDGSPCLNQIGVARAVLQYDEHGNRTEQAYFGVDGKPCLCRNGYAKMTWQYDERGNQTENAYFGVDGKPCLHKEGYAKVTDQYDERGNSTEQAFWGVDGNPCLRKDGMARIDSQYDERGNRTKNVYYDVDGKLCLHKDGYAMITIQYDEWGNRTEQAFRGIDGKLCLHKDGYAKLTLRYDERGNQTESAFFGVDGKPCMSKFGYSRGVLYYDDSGEVVGSKFYDDKGKVIKSSGQSNKKQKKQQLIEKH